MTKQELAERFKSARRSTDKSQEETAQALDLSRSAISAIEHGDRDISALEIWQFAQFVNYPVEYFLPNDRQYWKNHAQVIQNKIDRITAIILED